VVARMVRARTRRSRRLVMRLSLAPSPLQQVRCNRSIDRPIVSVLLALAPPWPVAARASVVSVPVRRRNVATKGRR
jgi:hypothetical protein